MVYFDFHCRNCFAYNRVFLLCCGCSEWTECCKTEQLLKYQNIFYLFIYFFRVIRAFYVLFGLLYICITQCSWLPAPFTLLLRRGGSRLSRRTVLTQEEKKKKTTTSSVVSKHLWVVVMQRGIRVASTRTVGNKVTASCQDTTDHNGKRVCWRWVCSQSCLLLFFSIIIITRVFFFKGRYLRRRRARSRGVLSTNVRGMPGQGTGGVSGLPTGALAHGHIAFFFNDASLLLSSFYLWDFLSRVSTEGGNTWRSDRLGEMLPGVFDTAAGLYLSSCRYTLLQPVVVVVICRLAL